MICCIPLSQLSGASPSPANRAIQLCSWACSLNLFVEWGAGGGRKGGSGGGAEGGRACGGTRNPQEWSSLSESANSSGASIVILSYHRCPQWSPRPGDRKTRAPWSSGAWVVTRTQSSRCELQQRRFKGVQWVAWGSQVWRIISAGLLRFACFRGVGSGW